jgi:NitT/TauT family transport system ATP-binding protein
MNIGSIHASEAKDPGTSAHPAVSGPAGGAGETVKSIELLDVTRSFPAPKGKGRHTALQKITFSANRGEFTSIVGPSGCGKSTLLSLISGLAAPDQGEVRVLGERVTSIRPDIGFIFQKDALLPWRTALQNVALGPRFRGVSRSEGTERARSWLARVGLSAFADSYPHQLSGGMRKRVAIASTMVYDPQVLLMDEPFSALDVETRSMMENDLLNLWQLSKPTVIFITHDLQEAVQLSDRVIVLSAGPGRVVGDYQVDLPRPRDLPNIRFDDRAIELQREIWTILREEVQRAYARDAGSGSGVEQGTDNDDAG